MSEKVNINELIEKNYALVGFVIKRMGIHPGFDCYEDILQEGYIGLIKAAKAFKPELNFKFSTYATVYVEGYIKRAIQNISCSVKVPRQIKELKNKVRLLRQKGFEDDEICDKLKIDLKKLLKVDSFSDIKSLNHPMKDNGDDLQSTLESNKDVEREALESMYYNDLLKDIRARLKEREYEILLMLQKNKKQVDIGNELGITQASVSRHVQRIRFVVSQMGELVC